MFIYKASSGELLLLTFINFHNEVVAFLLSVCILSEQAHETGNKV